jgi:hypothetical protein
MLRTFCLAIVLTVFTACGEKPDNILSEGSMDVSYERIGGRGWATECKTPDTPDLPETHYTGPALSTPLPTEKKWGVTVPVGGVYGTG